MEQTAPEGKWVLGGGIELHCRFYIFACEEHKNKIRNAIKAPFARQKSRETLTQTRGTLRTNIKLTSDLSTVSVSVSLTFFSLGMFYLNKTPMVFFSR